jgi:hypothetical protein
MRESYQSGFVRELTQERSRCSRRCDSNIRIAESRDRYTALRIAMMEDAIARGENILPVSGGSASAPAASSVVASAATTRSPTMRALMSRITRDQGPEYEQTMSYINVTQQTLPTALKTDRKIAFYLLHVKGRITVGASPVTFRSGPPLLGTPLFSLIQNFQIHGQHQRFGAQTPIVMRGESAAEFFTLMWPNYEPFYRVSINGGTPVSQGALSGLANATNDFEFVLPIPLFPVGINPAEQSFWAYHGPDWAGNLYIDVLPADPTALGVTLASLANSGNVTAYNSSSGNGTIDIMSERPLLTKTLAANIRPGITFRTTNSQQPTAVANGSSAAGSAADIFDAIVGKDTTRFFVKAGTQLSGTSANVVVYGSLSDQIFTQTFFSLDSRTLRFQGANRDSCLQDNMARAYGRAIPIGYKVLDFIQNRGGGPSNAKASFPSTKMTAARKFQVNADTTSASNQIAEVVQENLLGRPGFSGTAPANSSASA